MKKILLTLFLGLFLFNLISAFDSDVSLYERYNTGDNTGENSLDSQWLAQTFTIGDTGSNETFNLTGVSLKLSKSGSPTDINISILAVNSGTPNSTVLVRKEVDASSFSGAWENITFDSIITLQKGETYAISVENPSADPNLVNWKADSTSPPYTGGQGFLSSDDGDSWEVIGSKDFMFEVWGMSLEGLKIFSTYPDDDSEFLLHEQPTILANVNSIGGVIPENISLLIDGEIYSTNTSGAIGEYSFELSTLSPGQHNYTIQGVGNDTESYESTNGTLNFNLSRYFINSITFNSTTYETATETYSINITSNNSLTAVSLLFNGTEYSMSKSGSVWSKTLEIPTSSVGNNSIQFNLTYGGVDYSSNISYQYVNNTYFTICNSTYTNDFLNLLFKDEGNLSSINAGLTLSTFTYSLTSGGTTKEYQYINTTEQSNFSFCAYPTDRTFYVTPYVQYKQGTDYPQRIWNPSVQTYTSTATNQSLYLLSSVDGIYVTFQIINTADQLISGVDVTAVREISGSDVEVASGTTSAAGSVTFWLNPDFVHTFTFSKTGYDTYSYDDTPTQTSYTVTLGQAQSVQNDTFRGIDYSLIPTNTYLENDTNYTFGFNLTSSYWDVSEYGFSLRLANGTTIDGGSTGTEGTELTLSYDVNNQSIIYMDYYWVINGNYTRATRYWIVQNTEYEGYSIKTFFTDLNSYLDSGLFGLDNFGRILIVFMILFISVGAVSYKFGVVSPLGVMTLMFAIVFFFDVVIDLIPTIRGIENLPTFIVGLMLTLTIINEVRMR